MQDIDDDRTKNVQLKNSQWRCQMYKFFYPNKTNHACKRLSCIYDDVDVIQMHVMHLTVRWSYRKLEGRGRFAPSSWPSDPFPPHSLQPKLNWVLPSHHSHDNIVDEYSQAGRGFYPSSRDEQSLISSFFRFLSMAHQLIDHKKTNTATDQP